MRGEAEVEVEVAVAVVVVAETEGGGGEMELEVEAEMEARPHSVERPARPRRPGTRGRAPAERLFFFFSLFASAQFRSPAPAGRPRTPPPCPDLEQPRPGR